MLNISTEAWIQIAVITVGWIVTVVKIDGRLKSVEKDIKEVASLARWRERFEERVQMLRRDIDEMRHFRGFVRPPHPTDGEDFPELPPR